MTPGGLGVIEVALAAALVSAGISSQHALTGVLVYRLISCWLVMAGGWVLAAILVRVGRQVSADVQT